MKLKRLTTISAAGAKQINNLLVQLSGKKMDIKLAHLKKAAADKKVFLFALIEADIIIGMGTLLVCDTASGHWGTIEDVVVDEVYRGKGLGKLLMQALIDQARKLKLEELELSSRPHRIAANTLYQKLGFQAKETNVYRLKL